MMRTVNAVAAARKTARYVCSPRFLNASSGPYAEDERPSAPRPTQARKAMSERCGKRCGSCRASGPRAQLPCRRDLAAWRDALNDETNTGQRAFRVLVVDDERNIRKTLAVCLESLGCAVTECGTAAAAIDSLARLPHDLAFVDLRLGKGGGLGLLGSLLRGRPAPEGMLITAYPANVTPGPST